MGYIVTKELTKVFGYTIALDSVSISIEKPFHILLGPNGSGKSTLISILAGVRRPTKGYAYVFGIEPYRNPEAVADRASFLLDRARLPPLLNVREFLRAIAVRIGINLSDIIDMCREILNIDFFDKLCHTLSAGMAKKVALCAVLAGEPELVVLDEPFSNLDAVTKRKLVEYLIDRAKRGLKNVVATHIATELIEIEDLENVSITVLINGRAVVHGDALKLAEEHGYIYIEIPAEKDIVLQLTEAGKSFHVRNGKLYLDTATAQELGVHGRKVADIARLYDILLHRATALTP